MLHLDLQQGLQVLMHLFLYCPGEQTLAVLHMLTFRRRLPVDLVICNI